MKGWVEDEWKYQFEYMYCNGLKMLKAVDGVVNVIMLS